MKTLIRLSLFSAALALVAPFASAQASDQSLPSRIGVVDVQKVFSESNAGKVVFEKLRKRQEELVAMARSLDEEVRTLDSDINTKRAGLSSTRLSELQNQLNQKREELQRFAQQAEQEIGLMRDRELQGLELKIKPIIDTLAKELNLAALFNKFESGLVYADERLDISDEVIARFNAQK